MFTAKNFVYFNSGQSQVPFEAQVLGRMRRWQQHLAL
jgi:hypothetical protein